MSLRVGFLTTHPIQYQAPIFRLLAERSDLEFVALFCQLPDARKQGDGFGVAFQWDVPLLDGYEYVVLKNVARSPSVTCFAGCDTPDIRDELRRNRIDVLVVHGWVVKSCLQGLRACRRLEVPCLVRGEANLHKRRPWWKLMLQRRLVQQYAACLYIGRANREFYVRHGVADDKLFAAPYCVENRRFTVTAAEHGLREAARRRFSIPDRAACFLFCGKFVEKKHPLELLQAFDAVCRQAPEMHLLLVGDGELRTRCEEFVRSRRLSATFSGFLNQSEMAQAYVAADCLVLPSDDGETWGLVVNEAMACGRPALVSDRVGCAADLIRERETGATFPFGDWQQLTQKLLELGQDCEHLQAMGQAASRHVAAYSPEAAAEGIARAAHFASR